MSTSIRKGLGVAAVAALALFAGAARAQAPAGYTCGDGLQGQLFELGDDVAATAPDRIAAILGTVTDSVKDSPFYDFGSDAPTAAFPNATAADHFFDRWFGGFLAPADGDYTFTISLDDGGRLWLSDKPIDLINPGVPAINSWVDQGTTSYSSPKVHLSKGQFEYILFEHYENGGGSVAKLSIDGGTDGIDKADLCAGPAPGAVMKGTLNVEATNGGTAYTGPITATGSSGTRTFMTDDTGKAAVTVLAGDYDVVAAGETAFSDPVKVTVPDGGAATATINKLTTLMDIDLSTDEGVGSWVSYGEGGTVAFGDFQYADPKFDDSSWAPTEAPQAGKDIEGSDLDNNWWGWYRGHVKLPADFPRDTYAVLWHYNYDDTDLAFFNGHGLGGVDWLWEWRRRFPIPKAWLQDDNVIADLGYDGHGGGGWNEAAPHLHTGNPSVGALLGHIVPTPNPWGAAGGIFVTATNSSGQSFGSVQAIGGPAGGPSPPTEGFGYYSLMDLPPGDYTLTFKGDVIDSNITQKVTVPKGDVALVPDINANPAIYLSQQFIPGVTGSVDVANIADGVKGDKAAKFKFKDFGGDKPGDDQAAPGLSDSDWFPMTTYTGIAQNDNMNSGATAGNWGVYRDHFTAPVEMQAALKGRKMVLDLLHIDGTDNTFYINGTKIGSNTDNSTVKFTVDPSLVQFGKDNVLAIITQYNNGWSGGSDANNAGVGRLRGQTDVEAGGVTPTPTLGDLNGDNKVNVQDATLSLNIAVGILIPNADQQKAGDYNQDGKLNIQDTTLILNKAVSG